MKSEALLIGNKNMSDEKKEVLEELLFRMNAVKTAEDKKYVLMNAPKDKLEEIIAVLPGMKSPTIMPLAQEGWCSVHTVLDEKRFWEIIGKLKGLGAEGKWIGVGGHAENGESPEECLLREVKEETNDTEHGTGGPDHHPRMGKSKSVG